MNKKEAAELLERLRKMKETDIEQVNRDDLVDIKDVKIKTELPLEERIPFRKKLYRNRQIP